jgi:hypothetical protein
MLRGSESGWYAAPVSSSQHLYFFPDFTGKRLFRIIPNICATAMGPTKIQSVGLDISNNVEARGELYYHQSLQPQSTQRACNTSFIGLFHIVRLERASPALSQVFHKPICYIGTPGAPSHLDSFP